MARTEYVVVQHEGSWAISYAGIRHGPYKSKRDAIRFAVDAAYKAGCLGHYAQVLLQKRGKTTRIEWTYGTDPYPPES